jgi:RimJ/RimL family protein N-acetyltransferase
MAVLSDVGWPPGQIATDRLVLRQTQASDRSSFIEVLCSEEVRRFLGGAHAREDVERAMPEVPSAHPGTFAIDLDGLCIGAVLVERRDEDRPGHVHPAGNGLEVSYSLLPVYWGEGYASEAVAAALASVWGQFPSEPVVLCTQVANERSMALARRLGFEEAERFFEHGAEQWLGVRWPNETDAG